MIKIGQKKGGETTYEIMSFRLSACGMVDRLAVEINDSLKMGTSKSSSTDRWLSA